MVDLGAYAGVTGLVQAEDGSPSAGTRVTASFPGRLLEATTGFEGRYTFQGIQTSVSGTLVTLTYFGPDGSTVGGSQSVTLDNSDASTIVSLPSVRIDGTPPQLVEIFPADGAQNVSPDASLRFVFSEPIAPRFISLFYLWFRGRNTPRI